MTRTEFDIYCATLTATTNVVQWGDASVWKVGGKIFAIHSFWGEGGDGKIAFKCSDLAFKVLQDMPGLIPAPYLSRAKWIQMQDPKALSEPEIKSHISAAHGIIAAKLSQKHQKELGLC